MNKDVILKEDFFCTKCNDFARCEIPEDMEENLYITFICECGELKKEICLDEKTAKDILKIEKDNEIVLMV